ncbi:MAG: hypothetical protein JKY65_08620 [Planctomycetes bacterium]|nr:hypothetical protein [Planctomycetota bacterium]
MAGVRDKAKKFSRFVKGLEGKHKAALPDTSMPLLDAFVFYLLFYSNPVTHARRAHRALTDDKQFTSWTEVRVSTAREITDVLEKSKIKHADFLAPRLLEFLQRLWEVVDETRLEAFTDEIALAAEEGAKAKKDATARVRATIEELPGIPPWGATYLLAALGLDKTLPLDPFTEEVFMEQDLFGAEVRTLPQKRRVLKALLESVDGLGTVEVHHLIVEYAKRDLKRR